MFTFLQETITPPNLPFTIILLLTMLYWIFVIIGAIDLEFLDIDLSADGSPDAGDGFFTSFLQLLKMGDAPIMATVSMMALIAWTISMVYNHYLNFGYQGWIAAGVIAANFIVSFFITVLIGRLLNKIFGPFNSEEDVMQSCMYKMGTVITSEVNSDFGQVEIQTQGAPVTINARTPDGLVLLKGEKVLVYDDDKEKGVYFVDRYDENV
jgi:hypothetical protein